METVIESNKLVITRGTTEALRGVTFVMERGRIMGLIGPSGSGKTTLMRAIVGVQAIDNGSLTVFGKPAGNPALRAAIGYQPQSPAVYLDLTTRQNLEYFGRIFGITQQRVTEVLEQVDLTPQANQLAGDLSGGQLARVSLAVALLGDADVLVLDEPTVGLDPVLRERLWKLFAELAKSGKALLISSHVMDEAERCQDILLLRNGKVLSNSSKADLLKTSQTKTVEEAFLKLAGGNE